MKKTATHAEALTRAHVILMETEALSRTRQPDEFRLVNNQYNALQSWHDQHTGWRIRRSPAVIRLLRTPVSFIPGYIFRTLQNPRDFACFVWTLWYAETRLASGRGNEQQFLMSQLAERLEEHSATGYLAPHAAPLDFKRQADRYSLYRGLKALTELGGLQLVDGSSEEWVNQLGQEDALWEFTEVARSLILALESEQVNAAAQRLAGNPHQLSPARLPGAERVAPLQRAWRTLLLGPVLLRYDDREAFEALRDHAETVNFELGEKFGWQLDLRYEYAMIIRATGTSLSPLTLLNLVGATDQAALLVCDVIRQKTTAPAGEWRNLPQTEGCFVVAESEVAEIFRQVREEYGQLWGSTARKTSFQEFLKDVFTTLRQAGLIRGPDKHGNLLLLPTIARFAVTYNRPEEMSIDVPGSNLSITQSGQPLPANNSPTSYNTVQAARILGISEQSILNWLRTEFIKGERVGRGWFIPAEEVERARKLRWGTAQNSPANNLPTVQESLFAGPAETVPAAGENYTISQVAQIMGVVPQSVSRWIQQGKIQAVQQVRGWLIPADQLEKLKNQQKAANEEAK